MSVGKTGVLLLAALLALPAAADDDDRRRRDPKRVLLIGDSITFGTCTTPDCVSWSTQVENEFERAQFVNVAGKGWDTGRGWSGWTNATNFLHRTMREAPFDAVVVLLGTNDARDTIFRHHHPPEVYDQNMRALAAWARRLVSRGRRLVYLVTPPPFGTPGGAIPDPAVVSRLRAYRTKLLAFCAEKEEERWLRCVDLDRWVVQERDFPDDIHPNQSGMNAIADAVIDALRRDGWR